MAYVEYWVRKLGLESQEYVDISNVLSKIVRKEIGPLGFLMREQSQLVLDVCAVQ